MAAAAVAGGNTNSGVLQRSHAFKSRGSQPLLTSGSSLSEDFGTEGGGGRVEPGLPARPNHLPLAASGEKEEGGRAGGAGSKPGHAPWSSPEKHLPKSATATSSSSSSSERPAPPSSSSSSSCGSSSRVSPPTASSATSSSSSSTPARTALCFTNPLHSDNSDDDGDGEMGRAREDVKRSTSVSTATATVTTAPHHAADHPQPVRKVLPLSIAGQVTPDTDTNCWDSVEDSPPPLPERTPESFILATAPVFLFVFCHGLAAVATRPSVRHGTPPPCGVDRN
ncbi:hypothetical protein CRUP_021176 [Coryphaenoides rupestris]|nr:hypothetical protein CRUP_021176 [Coryphaenoides rupestris]